MGAWIRALWDAALFKTEAYERLRDRRDAFMQGFFVIVVVALLVALPAFVTQFVRGFRPPEAEIADARSGFQAVMDGITPFLGQMGLPAEAQGPILEQAKANFESVATMIVEIEALPTALPRPVGKTLTAFGAWVSHPFGAASFPLSAAVLATWLGYGIWVMLAAKLMGGRGTLTGFFGSVYYPAGLLPAPLVWISYLLPITYALNAMRLALLEGATWGQLLPDLLALSGFAVVLLPLSLLAFRYSVRRAKIEGSLTQY